MPQDESIEAHIVVQSGYIASGQITCKLLTRELLSEIWGMINCIWQW